MNAPFESSQELPEPTLDSQPTRSNEKAKLPPDLGRRHRLFPDASLIFQPNKNKLASEIKDRALVFLDSNILLNPYNFTIINEKKAWSDFQNAFKKCCEHLIQQKRLVIPGIVAREFADDRANLVSRLADQFEKTLVAQATPTMPTFELAHPIFSLIEGVDRLQERGAKLRKTDSERDKERQFYNSTVVELARKIRQWGWDDPLSQLYNNLFNQEVIVDLSLDEMEMREILKQRAAMNLPPGLTDRAKPDEGVGDVLIWQTILHLAETRKLDVILVTNETKSDWFVPKTFIPKYELIYEFKRRAPEQSFAIISYSLFLEFYGADEKVVDVVRREEENTQSSELTVTPTMINNAIFDWVRIKYGKYRMVRIQIFPPFMFGIQVFTDYGTSVVAVISAQDVTSIDALRDLRVRLNAQFSEEEFHKKRDLGLYGYMKGDTLRFETYETPLLLIISPNIAEAEQTFAVVKGFDEVPPVEIGYVITKPKAEWLIRDTPEGKFYEIS